jgi:hypothetical protein
METGSRAPAKLEPSTTRRGEGDVAIGLSPSPEIPIRGWDEYIPLYNSAVVIAGRAALVNRDRGGRSRLVSYRQLSPRRRDP